MKNIPIQNYIKVIILFAFTIIITLALASNYKQKIQYERSNQDIMGFLSTVKYEELENYLVENHDIFIYMASSADSSLDAFERDFKSYIIENELEKDFIYLDTSSLSHGIYEQLKNRFFSSELQDNVSSFGTYPNVMAVHNGKITSLLYSEKMSITINDIRNFVNIHLVSP